MGKYGLIVVVLALTVGFVSPSHAVITTYQATDAAGPAGPWPTSYSEGNAFYAVAGTLGTASIHGFGSQDVGNMSGLFSVGNVSWSYSGSAGYVPMYSGVTNGAPTGSVTDGFNVYPASDTNGPWLGMEKDGVLTLTFLSSPTESFGAFFSGLGTNLTVSFNDGASQSLTIPAIQIPGTPSGSGVEFWGFTDTSGFSQITIAYAGTCAANQQCDNFGVDGIIFNNVPEPGTMLFLSLGLVGVAGLRRKLRH